MADRTYIIEVLLEARDNMARAFAEATGELDAYNAELDKQVVKTKAAQDSQRDYSKSLTDGTTATERRKKSIEDLNSSYDKLNIKTGQNVDKQKTQVTSLKNLEAAQQRVTNAQRRGLQGTTEYTDATLALESAQKKFRETLQDTQGISETTARSRAKDIQQQIALKQATEATMETEAKLDRQRQQITQRATPALRTLANPATGLRDEYDATQRLAQSQKELEGTGLSSTKAQSLLNEELQKQYRNFGLVDGAERKARQEVIAHTQAIDLYLKASKEVSSATIKNPASIRATQIATRPPGSKGTPGEQTQLKGVDVTPNVSDAFTNLQKQFGGLQNSASGFATHVRNIAGVGLTSALQPLASLLVGMVGTYGSLASAAIAAGTAISTSFLSAVAQGVPVMGLFGAAMDRLRNVMGLVTGEASLQQQKFIAQYTAAYQNSLGINQVTIAQHSLSDALFAVGQAQFGVIAAQHSYTDSLFAENQAVFQVKSSELALLTARQQATRQLQQLVLQEQQAKLAAEASSLAVVDAQKALQQAIATGGDVQSAQLQLSQAQVQHHASVVSAQQAITDAASGSIARQNINQQVTQASLAVTQAKHSLTDAEFATTQAQRAITQAQRSVVDAQFAAVQAKAAVVQAQQAQQGFNIATAAQLAYLRSQMTQTELSLANNILKIFDLFRGAHGLLTPMTNAILSPFIGITNEIFKLLHDPRITSALQGLANSMGSAIKTVSNTFLGNQGIKTFLDFIHAATANMGPLATIISNLFKGIGSVLTTAIPYVHQFAGFIAGLTRQFADWATSQKGKNWLRDWFSEAFKAAEGFIGLGVALGKFVAAVIGVGGGAKSGISLIKEFTGWINSLTDSINHHGKVWQDLQKLWSSAKPALSALHTILSAVGRAILNIGGTKQGQEGLKSLAHLVADVLVPAFAQFASNMGAAITQVGKFLDKHPELESFLKDMLAFSLTAHVGFRALGILLGPLTTILGVVSKIGPLLEGIETLIDALPEGFLAVAGPIGLIAAAIVAISAATHNMGNLINTVLSPFKLIWQDISNVLKPLEQAVSQLFNAFGIKSHNAHQDVADLLNVLKVFFRLVATGIVAPLTIFITEFSTGIKHIAGFIHSIVQVFKNVFNLVGDVIHGRWGKIVGDFKQIGKDIFNALWSVLTFIPDLIINIFKTMIKDVENFLGISSPSKKFKDIGNSIWNGIWEAIKSLPTLFLHIAEDAAKAFLKGIETLPGDVAKKLSNLNPISAITSGKGTGGLSGLTSVASSAINFFGGLMATGGPIPGFGGGDKWPRLLEGGEHVFTKDEVRAAGGHGAIFALRRSLGGGTQGGPSGYALGGVTAPSSRGSSTSAYGANTSATTLGDETAFVKKYLQEWTYFWQQIYNLNKQQQKYELDGFQNNFNDILNALTKFINQFENQINDFYTKINNSTTTDLGDFLNNFRWIYNKVDTDTFNAFWYIQHAANQSLKAFGAKPVDVTLGAQPKFAVGGFLGHVGERGKDLVPALLGRGEAVLNYAHQKVVEPAMRAFYGWGLGDMFNRVRGSHAGVAGEGGYAAGGYVFPIGGPATWERSDQGVDFSMAAGTPIGPIGRSRIAGILQNWYQGQPFIWWQLLDGARKGAYAYVAEQITNLARPGSIVDATQAVARYASSGTGIEYGWATPGGGTLAMATSGYTEGEATPAGQNMRSFLEGLQHGKITGGALGALGGAAAASWKKVKEQAVKGSGVLKDALQGAVKKVTNAANKFGQKKADQSGGTGGIGAVGGMVGNIMQLAQKAAGLFHVPWDPNIVKVLLSKESGGGQNEPPSGSLNATGPFQVIPSTFAEYEIPGHHNIRNPWDNTLAAFHYISSRYHTLANLAATTGLLGSGYVGYKGGGFAGDAIPIIAHAGEWVVNGIQQSKLANAIGTSVSSLKNALGFTGGPQSFAGGGEVQHYAKGKASDLPGIAPSGASGAAPSDPYSIGIPAPSSTTGAYTAPTLSIDLPSFYAEAIAAYTQAQKIIQKLDSNDKNFTKGLNTFLKNFNAVGGDDGIFALAAQAIQDFVTQQGAIVQLAAAGYHIVNNKIEKLKTGAQTTAQAAAQDLQSTNVQIGAINTLQNQQEAALKQVNKEIDKLGTPTAANMKQFQQLIGARQTLITDINTQDQNLAQAYTDRYNKQVALFQAQVAAQQRQAPGHPNTTLTGKQVGAVDEVGGSGQIQSSLNNLFGLFGKVGPTITSGLAQMTQTIAQTLGNPAQLQDADQYVITAAKQQQSDLQSAYAAAAKKAQKDPRWQSVADDLLGQLESATTAVAQAQAQALTDAITAVQNQASIQSAATGMATTIAQALGATSSIAGPANQYASIGQQIGISQANTVGLNQQLWQYQGLYNQAQSEGNVGAQQQLIQAMDDLRGQIAQANVQTQQLITQYQQLSVTLQQSIASQEGTLNQSATGIFTTIGQITGNQNLPALISAAQDLGTSLVQSGQQAVQDIMQSMSSTAFGAAQGGANTLLGQAVGAFNQGPQAYASWLAANAPQLSTFAAGLPSDEQTLFNGLIQSLTDNTTAVVNNTLNLQQLNATTNQQQFTSSAWTMFREAIFSGIGTLLPNYAMTVPSLDVGGTLTKSGLIYAHKDETIQPATVKKGETASKVVNNENHFHIEHPMEVADPVHFGNQVGWRLNHDPNSR